jgi:hypothetical protein
MLENETAVREKFTAKTDFTSHAERFFWRRPYNTKFGDKKMFHIVSRSRYRTTGQLFLGDYLFRSELSTTLAGVPNES